MSRQDEEKRDRGILTQVDREFLRGEREVNSVQTERDSRYRIRNRVRDGLLDLEIIYEFLGEEDRKRVFQELEGEERLPVFSGGSSLLYQGIIDIEEDIQQASEIFEAMIERSVRRTVKKIKDDHLVNVSVDIDVEAEKPDRGELLQKFSQKEETREELQYLMKTSEDAEKDAQYIKRFIESYYEEGTPLTLEPGKNNNTLDKEQTFHPQEHDSFGDYLREIAAAMDIPSDSDEED